MTTTKKLLSGCVILYMTKYMGKRKQLIKYFAPISEEQLQIPL